MSRTKKIFLIAAIILIITAIISFFFFKKTQPAPTPAPSSNNQLPIGAFKMPSPSDLVMTINTPGGTVTTNNVYKNSLYPLSKNGVAFHDNSDYYAAFYPEDQGFLIVLQNPDIKLARNKAEAEFIQTLGITKEQACLLKVSITIPADISEQYSGKVYGLSFCPGAKTF